MKNKLLLSLFLVSTVVLCNVTNAMIENIHSNSSEKDKVYKLNQTFLEAASSGDTDTLTDILESKDIDLLMGDVKYCSLESTGHTGKTEVFKLLLYNKNFMDTTRKLGMSCAFCSAAQNGHIIFIKFFLDDSICMNQLYHDVDFARYALVTASSSGESKVVDLLLNDKNFMKIITKNGVESAIFFAKFYKHLDIVEMLTNDSNIKKLLNINE